MANPVIVACASNVWTKVATNVTSGQVHIKDNKAEKYLQTYRTTGEAAPDDDDDLAEGIPLLYPTTQIEATAGIDVYIMPRGAAGSVRVDTA